MIRSKKTLRGFAAVAGVAALTLTAACGSSGNSDKKDTGGTAKSALCGKNIAFLGALTGDAGALGQNMVNGVNLALKEYNAKNADCQVNLKTFDSQGSPDKAPALATQIVNDDTIFGLVGPGFSGESLATGKTFFEAGLPSISPSATNVTITQQGWTTWHRLIGNDDAQGSADAKYLTTTAGAKKVYVIDDGQDYSKGLAGTVKKALGSALVDSDQISVGQTDMSAVVTKVKASGADAVFYGGYYTEAGLIRKALTNAGVTATMVGADGAKDPAFIDGASKQAAEGTVFTCPCLPPTEVKGSFPADYKALHGVDPGTYSDNAFDAANILLAGIKAGKTTRADMLTFVKGYTGEGAVGSYKFTETGELDPSAVKIWAYKVQNGEIVPVKQVPLA